MAGALDTAFTGVTEKVSEPSAFRVVVPTFRLVLSTVLTIVTVAPLSKPVPVRFTDVAPWLTPMKEGEIVRNVGEAVTEKALASVRATTFVLSVKLSPYVVTVAPPMTA